MNSSFRSPLAAIDPQIVRAYDFRGRARDQLTAQVVYWLGRAYATQLRGLNTAPVCIGADGRDSGPELKQALIAGLREGGADVIDCGFCTTPVVYFAASQQEAMNAVVLTASHNPADQNGVKLILNGLALLGEEISALAQLAISESLTRGAGTLREQMHDAAYVHCIAQRFSLKPGPKIVVDCANGIAGPVTQMLFKRLSTRLSLLFDEVDGQFPNHSPDPCIAENLLDLQRAVLQQRADIGFALDGDADRVVAISSSGRMLMPDQLLMLLAQDILTNEPGGLVLMDAKCSALTRTIVEEAGGQLQIGRTGHSPMKRLMQASGAVCGGELSAHYYFADWYGFDDGLFTAVRLLDLMQRRGQSLDQLIDSLPKRLSTPEMRLDIDDTEKFDIIDRLQRCNFSADEIVSIDGLRVEYPFGWGLIRASNTEAALVVRFEADNIEQINLIIAEFNRNLTQIGAKNDPIELFTDLQGGSHAT
ncbi:MAG TPA: phosphomannomutase/phosphoglucomutase [Marinobacterium sp.]|nr:phosphomannomutase/phosphoglucomutase [Marinobacterium sp.]